MSPPRHIGRAQRFIPPSRLQQKLTAPVRRATLRRTQPKDVRMRRRAVLALAGLGWLLVVRPAGAAHISDERRILGADAALFQALALSDGAKAAQLLDKSFTWTGSDGATLALDQFRQNLPKPGPYVGTDIKLRIYGRVAVVTSDLDAVHALRIWVKEPQGWRALAYHEVTQTAPPAGAGAPVKADCENPCRTLPYAARNAAERGAIASWQALESAVVAGNSKVWASHVADEFVVVSNFRVQDKAARIAAIDRGGTAPAPLVSANFFDFGDTLAMTAQHQPYTGKPIRVTRVWIKRAGSWLMAISYQTIIQAASVG
jgi:hypothetical protein